MLINTRGYPALRWVASFFCVYVVKISSNNEKIFSAQKADMQSICYWNLVCNGCGVYKLICFDEYFMYFYI